MTTAALSPSDRERLRSALESRRQTLRNEARAQMQGSGDDRVVGLANRIGETDDWAVADALAELDIGQVRHTLAELAEVDAALARMRDGTYGECLDCGTTIAAARLFAYPAARRCIACQQAFEKKAAGPPLTAV